MKEEDNGILKEEYLPPEAWKDFFESERTQLIEYFKELKDSYSKWVNDEISDKSFVGIASSLLMPLEEVISKALENYGIVVGQLKEVVKIEYVPAKKREVKT